MNQTRKQAVVSLRSGVSLKCPRRKPERGNQIGFIVDVTTGRLTLGIHRGVGGQEHDQPTRLDLIDRFGEEVVMNRCSQLVVPAVCWFHVRERYVADDQVVEVVGGLGLLVPLLVDVCLRVENLGHASRELVEFDPGEAGGFLQVFGHHGKEVANPHRRFKHSPAVEAHPASHVPHRLDGFRVRVVGVDDRLLGGFPFFFAQVIAQPFVLGFPPRFDDRAVPAPLKEFLAEGSPSSVGRDGVEFLGRRLPVLGSQFINQLNSPLVAGKLILRSGPNDDLRTI
jgi:hypothetical protein